MSLKIEHKLIVKRDLMTFIKYSTTFDNSTLFSSLRICEYFLVDIMDSLEENPINPKHHVDEKKSNGPNYEIGIRDAL